MVKIDTYYIDYLKKLKKNDLIDILNNYNNLSKVFNNKIIEYKNLKKDNLIDIINNNIDNYLRYIITLLDIEDYNNLKCLIKKEEINKELIDYLTKVNLIYDNIMCIDIYKNIVKLIKDKNILNKVKKVDKIYKLTEGIIIAYGVVDIKYYNIIISGIENKNKILDILKLYYKKSYIIKDKMILSKKLSNKKRINKYYKDNKYKLFTNKEYLELASNKYHHKIKEYKKFIKILKSYYVYKKKDIDFIDKNIIIPYLYNSLNEEEESKKVLEDTLINLFEFRGVKLKKVMMKRIMAIRDYFPLWEYRGYSKVEVKDE